MFLNFILLKTPPTLWLKNNFTAEGAEAAEDLISFNARLAPGSFLKKKRETHVP
jgi:hypothetical protein